jgi:ribosomal protein L14
VAPRPLLWRRRTRLVWTSEEGSCVGEVDNKWNETAWAKKLAARAKKAAMCDFCRFKARYAKKH